MGPILSQPQLAEIASVVNLGIYRYLNLRRVREPYPSFLNRHTLTVDHGVGSPPREPLS